MNKNFKPEAWFLPQPVMVIGTYDADGTPNAMNAAWGGQWDYKQVFISMGNHQTTRNLERCGDFTLAFATADTLVAADYVGIVSGKTHPDKLKATGWKVTKGANVDAPVFDCFPLTMECRIVKKYDESETGFYLVADILNIICDERFLAADGKPDVAAMRLITYDPVHHTYLPLAAESAGQAFHDGGALKDKE